MALATSTLHLAPFAPAHAAAIASWVRDEQQLQWVSPATQPPLTPDKVQRWPRPDGEAFVLLSGSDGVRAAEPLAYSELNHMRSGRGNWWIGHFIVHPDCRGRGLGRTLLHDLLVEAFERLEAKAVCLVVFPDNSPAIRCYESGGFKRVGHEYHRFANHKHRIRLVRYEMTSDMWLSNQGHLIGRAGR